MFRITSEILGTRQLDLALVGLKKDISDLRPIWPLFLAEARKLTGLQFSTRGRRGHHGRWQNLDPKYAAAKAKKFPGKQIMIRSGDMFGSLVARTQHSIVDMSQPLSMEYGTRIPYATYHQHGSLISNLPKRRVLDFTDRDQLIFAKIVQTHFNQNVYKKHFISEPVTK